MNEKAFDDFMRVMVKKLVEDPNEHCFDEQKKKFGYEASNKAKDDQDPQDPE